MLFKLKGQVELFNLFHIYPPPYPTEEK